MSLVAESLDRATSYSALVHLNRHIGQAEEGRKKINTFKKWLYPDSAISHLVTEGGVYLYTDVICHIPPFSWGKDHLNKATKSLANRLSSLSHGKKSALCQKAGHILATIERAFQKISPYDPTSISQAIALIARDLKLPFSDAALLLDVLHKGRQFSQKLEGRILGAIQQTEGHLQKSIKEGWENKEDDSYLRQGWNFIAGKTLSVTTSIGASITQQKVKQTVSRVGFQKIDEVEREYTFKALKGASSAFVKTISYVALKAFIDAQILSYLFLFANNHLSGLGLDFSQARTVLSLALWCGLLLYYTAELKAWVKERQEVERKAQIAHGAAQLIQRLVSFESWQEMISSKIETLSSYMNFSITGESEIGKIWSQCLADAKKDFQETFR